ncbi:hypothetical protein ACFQ68_44145 [Amycolatopsis japonica]|uniref:hypothetical protein n=1 Tax=Amycolatopsis japonica TaxID=208439 RepID=UPI003672DCB2
MRERNVDSREDEAARSVMALTLSAVRGDIGAAEFLIPDDPDEVALYLRAAVGAAAGAFMILAEHLGVSAEDMLSVGMQRAAAERASADLPNDERPHR